MFLIVGFERELEGGILGSELVDFDRSFLVRGMGLAVSCSGLDGIQVNLFLMMYLEISWRFY